MDVFVLSLSDGIFVFVAVAVFWFERFDPVLYVLNFANTSVSSGSWAVCFDWSLDDTFLLVRLVIMSFAFAYSLRIST